MSVLCTGSIAIDQIMVFHDYFKNHILPEKIHAVNVSFYVPKLEKRYGGTAANIAYHLRILGLDPILLATVGHRRLYRLDGRTRIAPELDQDPR